MGKQGVGGKASGPAVAHLEDPAGLHTNGPSAHHSHRLLVHLKAHQAGQTIVALLHAHISCSQVPVGKVQGQA